ncbi:MAG TPA: VapC toxin family PIN domain ribonuclease [Legionella sp.]|nr:VapC toxin family PIN domain ribonuclease [Legionella sp.]
MMRYLLDTNILSDVIKNPQGMAAKRMMALDNNDLFTSIIVASEIRYGVEKKKSALLSSRVELLLQMLDVLPFDVDADRYYGKIRFNLEQQGQIIGANDLLIAAHARSLDAVLVTDNTREFARVEGLNIENWLK